MKEEKVLTLQNIKFQDILDYCLENNQVAWLKEVAATKIIRKDEKGEEYEDNITFIELKLAFVRKFMPEIAPAPKVNKPTMFDIINAL